MRDDAAAARYSLDVTASKRYLLDFYASDSCDTAGNGEGKHWLGYTAAEAVASGYTTFNSSTFDPILDRTIDLYEFPPTTFTHITATATEAGLGTTSELSSCISRVALPELVISKEVMSVTEDSASGTTYTVRLASSPTGDVEVTLVAGNGTKATVLPDTLEFTSTDWFTNKTVTVTGVSDADPLDEATSILHSVSIGDHEYPTARVPVEVTDDDAPGLTLNHDDFPNDVSDGNSYDGVLRLDEGGTDTYTMVLDSQPSDDVIISLSRSNRALTVSPTSITFTKTGEAQDPDEHEWNAAQTITLTPKDDSEAFDEMTTVKHKVSVGNENYTLAQVRVLVRDLALPALTYAQNSSSVSEVSVNEGGTATYTVRPETQPSADLTVNLSSSDEASVTVSPSSLTFTVGTNGNWETLKLSQLPGSPTMTSSMTLQTSFTSPNSTKSSIA